MKPKITFENLPAAKQNRIISEAVHEFAVHGYRRASLNTLVKKLGIAKGSLYQYFENKEALYLFIFHRFTGLVKKILKDSVNTEPENDFFKQVDQTIKAGLKFIDHYPEYYQIYLRLQLEQETPKRVELLQKVRLFSKEYFGALCQQAQEAGKIRSDQSCSTIIFCVESMLDRFMETYAAQNKTKGKKVVDFPGASPYDQIENIIAILQKGLCP